MKSLLGNKLRYLSDEELAKTIVDGTYDIPADLDDTTKLMLKEVGKMGSKIRNGEGKELPV